MSRRPAPKPDPVQPGGYLPNGTAAKSGLNKSILDAGWAQFASILAAKAEEAGRRVILVNPACTSIDCHACGARCTRPRQDTVICLHCGPLDADVNGARNSTPGPGWALIRPERLEKPPPSGGGAVTCQSLTRVGPELADHIEGPLRVQPADPGGQPIRGVIDDPDRLVGASHRITESMGSKISLRAIVMSLRTSVKMVGSTHMVRSNRRPARAPRHTARWRLRPGWFRCSAEAGRAPRPR